MALVIERRAPKSVKGIEAASAPVPLGHGRIIYDPSDEFLAALRKGYMEAAGRAASGGEETEASPDESPA